MRASLVMLVWFFFPSVVNPLACSILMCASAGFRLVRSSFHAHHTLQSGFLLLKVAFVDKYMYCILC